MRVIVIGGGPAGMMAAISAAESGNEVTILEKNKTLGKKLLITGKGRCNITSSLEMSEFIKNIPGNGRFLFSALKNFTNQDIIELLKQEGLEVKEERGNRVFPITDSSEDVLNCFEKRIKKLNVNVLFESEAKRIDFEEERGIKRVKGVLTNKGFLKCDRIILATGGKSYPGTGSSGDGYKIARELGHSIETIKPSLVPLEVYESDLCKELQGLSLKNIEINLRDLANNKIIYTDFGEMLFTHFGISGPTVLSASSHLVRYKNITNLMKEKKIKFEIDFKPALSTEKLNQRILRDFEKVKNKDLKNSLDKLLPQKLINPVVRLSKIDETKKVNSITKREREELVNILKRFELHIKGFRDIKDAIITSGGISTKEINPKTMQSKLIEGLYFAGEIIDVDGLTGGFNLQIAYSTGYIAGLLQQ